MDKYTIIVLIFALLACFYTLTTGNRYKDQCNEHWYKQLETMYDQCGCKCGTDNQFTAMPFNQSFRINILTNGTQGKD